MKLLEKRMRQFFWILPLGFYIVTMAKTIGYVDAALVLSNAHQLKISAWVNNHNLFSLLGWLWMKIIPIGSAFLRINLLSTNCGAFTVYFLFLTCLDYSKNVWISVITALALMTSHSLWWHATMLEVYTLNTLLIALILHSGCKFLITHSRKWLWTALLFWGLGISNHVLMGLFLPALATLIFLERKHLRAADLGVGLGFLLLGSGVFLFAVTKSYLRCRSLVQLFDLMTGGDFRSLMFSDAPKLFWRLNYILLIAYQYPSLMLLFLCCGTVLLIIHHGKFDLFIIAALLPQIVWSANYFVWDMYAFSLPVYVLLSLALCKGLLLFKRKRVLIAVSVFTLALPFFLYNNVHKIPAVKTFVARYPMVDMVEDAFDPVHYFLNPEKSRFRQVDTYARALFSYLPQNAWYYDNAYDYPLHYYYQDIRQERKDVHIPVIFSFWTPPEEIERVSRQINSRIQAQSPVYVAPYIYRLLKSKLQVQRIEKIKINDSEIFRLY